MNFFHRLNFPAAQSAAYSMVSQYGVDAAFVAQREVDAKIRGGDLDGALKIDQVRRELLDLIVEIEPPAHY
ncbi:hypothetical protein [Sphingomonas echinoides]|uniref:hypothetical protein n=1 Tax=Sphingomonas echinoides TaxID=59803 RepID=UPI00241317CB|nr:hypothetical protein [Sphingomonas echinoides]